MAPRQRRQTEICRSLRTAKRGPKASPIPQRTPHDSTSSSGSGAVSEPLLLTEEQAAERLLLHPRTLRKERQAGRIRYVALAGRKIAYRPEDCVAYVEARSRQEATLPAPRPRGRAVGNRRGGNIVPFSARQGMRL